MRRLALKDPEIRRKFLNSETSLILNPPLHHNIQQHTLNMAAAAAAAGLPGPSTHTLSQHGRRWAGNVPGGTD